ncbi:ATP-dependent zinc metalloprotease FTSH 10, mitochondrial-like [Dorcoceras hygrometricum]|uniref:ATP-dependent zinc metalloprotease FTSH 10, mitochondrial-like n=1 Tax=Dorcoceras hygrometricum TaxID=472368 RepID=A0A2Z7CMX6_9LAMI|nr:ATP-dependent zinc metalloprotease FTSH 10, mitochondrial-like [Dorcoceras hygrometricum]
MAHPTFTLATSFNTNGEGHRLATTAISRRPTFPRHVPHEKSGDDVPTSGDEEEDELRQLRDKCSRYIIARFGLCFLTTEEEKVQHILKCYPELRHEIDRILKQKAESEHGEDFPKEDEHGE